MAKPFLRYLPAKLQPLSAPAVWIPLTIFTLISILLWEYSQNPDWLERDPIINANPESTLTPDEQAKLSEIDTVDLLLKGAKVSSPLSSARTSGDPSNILNPVDLEAETTSGDRPLANRSDPFGAYTAEYKFPGTGRSSAGTTNSPTSQNLAPSNVSPTAFANFSSAAGSPPLATTPSALSEAIDRQEAIKASEAQRNDGASTSPSFLSQPSGSGTAENFSQSGLSPGATQTPRNVSVPFIRTTPAMSPPVGTTGYQAPATSNLPNFNLTPTPTTRNPSATPSPSGAVSPGQIGTVQASPIARPIQSNPTPTAGTAHTAPSSTQPEQNRRAR
ncbi:MAG: hypothetical protein DCF25_10300 [Leptolyngbya foveolarum]|uniref:Uncharacterized protein n=1 Tax=Leptolyngbya foveolarum TaxID=47253 RepID=A0A2W4W0T3_9CYAN|nr:MAG: hypothetical protein DCF25_10300 [Leptolyngbya foveolarum]